MDEEEGKGILFTMEFDNENLPMDNEMKTIILCHIYQCLKQSK